MNARPFDTHGTEGMLDVILGCTLIFLLLTALVRVSEGQGQERTLPALQLTDAGPDAAGTTRIARATISLAPTADGIQLSLDQRPLSRDELPAALAALPPGSQVAIRRDRTIPCGLEDEIILACQAAGIRDIALVVGTGAPNPTPDN